MKENEKGKKISKFRKVFTGIAGLDEITGGFPKGKITLIVGDTGCGKTIMAMEFLVKGALAFKEPGIFMSFEENAEELALNVESLDFDIDKLVGQKKIYLEHVEMDQSETLQTGKFDLEGLFVRLEHAIDRLGAKRVVLDSLDTHFYGLKYELVRSELRRLFTWLKKKEVTAVITAESGETSLTRQGLEEYVADCVIILNNRIANQVSTRRLRVVKYRGSVHGSNEYPFTIDNSGVNVFPNFSEIPEAKVSSERISSGIPALDDMLGGKGYFRGSSILVSGSAGTGKSSVAVSLVNAACLKKERCLYCDFEESPPQLIRNLGSIGLHLKPFQESGHLQFYFYRPTLQNLELHLLKMQRIIEKYNPGLVVLDPITNIMSEGINSEIRYMLVKFVDFLKSRQITVIFTAAITLETIKSNPSDEGISSMVDTWLLLRDIEKNGERNRGMYVLKSRGMKHSSQIREFVISNKGIDLIPAFIGNGEILTGAARKEYDLKEKTRLQLLKNDMERNTNEIKRARTMMEAEVSRLNVQFKSSEEELNKMHEEEQIKEELRKGSKKELESLRNEEEGKRAGKKKKRKT